MRTRLALKIDAEKTHAVAGNLEQAWQIFDLAKLIYCNAGDVPKECESSWERRVWDLTVRLAKRMKALPANSRSIAETHYQLGEAQAHCAGYAKAQKAAEALLNTRASNLEQDGGPLTISPILLPLSTRY